MIHLLLKKVKISGYNNHFGANWLDLVLWFLGKNVLFVVSHPLTRQTRLLCPSMDLLFQGGYDLDQHSFATKIWSNGARKFYILNGIVLELMGVSKYMPPSPFLLQISPLHGQEPHSSLLCVLTYWLLPNNYAQQCQLRIVWWTND